MSRPPFPWWLRGRAEIERALLAAGRPCAGARLVATAANGSPAFAQYRPAGRGGFEPFALVILELSGEVITEMTTCLDAGGCSRCSACPPASWRTDEFRGAAAYYPGDRHGGERGTMAGYVEVNGVNTWYDERGDGDPLVLLHGALTDSRDFTGSLDALAGRFRLLLPRAPRPWSHRRRPRSDHGRVHATQPPPVRAEHHRRHLPTRR